MNQASPQGIDLAEWIGRSEVTQDIASRSAAVGLAALLDRTLESPEVGAARLNPLGHWLHFNPSAPMRELGADGHPRLGGFMPPLDLPRRMWAGSKIAYHAPISIGQAIERTTTIESITPKSGSSGRLCFVVLRHDVRAAGALALVEHQTIVYREAVEVDPAAPSAQRPPRAATAAPEGWSWHEARQPNEVALLRYSALTFNGHRIHYDLPYTTNVEGYPGLVVHGPLSATYIVDSFSRQHPAAEIVAFEFSARSPLFVNEQSHVVGRTVSDAPQQRDVATGVEELAMIAPGGATAIVARLEYRS